MTLTKYFFSPMRPFMICVAGAFLGLMGCPNNSPDNQIGTQRPVVVATTTHLADLMDSLAGDLFEVIPLMGTGVDPHLYRPTSRDFNSIAKADLVVFHGLTLEGRIGDALSQAEAKGIPSFAATSRIPKELILSSNTEGGADSLDDPHVWFSPRIWSICASSLTERLIQLDPDSESILRANLSQLKTDIEMINQWSLSIVKEIPKERRKLVTSHDAFRYLGREFGIEVIGLQGVSTSIEAGLADRANLVDFIRKRDIPAIFVESSVNPAAMKEIAKEGNAVIGGELFSDALGPKDETITGPDKKSYGLGTWEGMMIHNMSTIAEALSGK